MVNDLIISVSHSSRAPLSLRVNWTFSLFDFIWNEDKIQTATFADEDDLELGKRCATVPILHKCYEYFARKRRAVEAERSARPALLYPIQYNSEGVSS